MNETLGQLLHNRQFLVLWLGQSVSQMGNWIRQMALTYWVYEVSGHSPTATAGMVIATALPALITGPLAASLAYTARRSPERRSLAPGREAC